MLGTVSNSDEEGFTFISCERLPAGMFVCYNDAGKNILCRVGHAEPLNHYPQEFLMDMELDADEVSGFYGLDPEDFRNSFYVIHGLGIIRNGIVKYDIDSPPDIRDKLELLSQDEMREFHTRNGKPSAAYFHSCRDSLDKTLLLCIAEQVESGCPECIPMMRLVKKHLRRD